MKAPALVHRRRPRHRYRFASARHHCKPGVLHFRTHVVVPQSDNGQPAGMKASIRSSTKSTVSLEYMLTPTRASMCSPPRCSSMRSSCMARKLPAQTAATDLRRELPLHACCKALPFSRCLAQLHALLLHLRREPIARRPREDRQQLAHGYQPHKKTRMAMCHAGDVLVGRPGFEPGTNRLKVYCSTN